MPRKTNKTARVLNLLSNGTGTSDIETEQPQTSPAEKATSKPAAANIQFMPSPTSSGDSLAGLIKESLDKEISKYHAENESAGNEIVNDEASFNTAPMMEPSVSVDVSATPENANESIVSKPAEATAPIVPASPAPSAPMVSDATLAAVNTAIDANTVPTTINDATETVISSPATTANTAEITVTPSATATVAPVSAVIPPTTATSAPEAAIISPTITAVPEPVPEEVDYLYINVTEHLLEERQIEFMNRFDVCTCDRCVLDVKALAMTNLPSKYMVMPRANMSPMMNYFRSKYNINIVTEVTKACFEILNNPRH